MLKKILLGIVFYISLNANLFALDSPIIGENKSNFHIISAWASCTPNIGNTEIIIYNTPAYNKQRIDEIHCQTSKQNNWFLTIREYGENNPETICNTQAMPYFTDGKVRYFEISGKNQCRLIDGSI